LNEVLPHHFQHARPHVAGQSGKAVIRQQDDRQEDVLSLVF